MNTCAHVFTGAWPVTEASVKKQTDYVATLDVLGFAD